MFPRLKPWTTATIHSFRIHLSRRAAWPINPSTALVLRRRVIRFLTPLSQMRKLSSQQLRLRRRSVRLSMQTQCQLYPLPRLLEPLHSDRVHPSRPSSNSSKLQMAHKHRIIHSNSLCQQLLKAQDPSRLNLNFPLSSSSNLSSRLS